MTTRTITNRRGAVFTVLLDDDDAHQYDQNTWCVCNGYAVRRDTANGRALVGLHRELLGHPDGIIDHWNRNRLDNQRHNLRLGTVSQNACNKKRQSTNTSGYVGVSYSKRHSKWETSLKKDGQKHWLGYFNTPLEASLARDRAALIHHGKFAALNHPDLVLAS